MSFFKWLSNKLNPPKARVILEIQKNEYVLGEEVKGEVQIISEEEFDVEQIAVSLACWENLKKTRTVSTQVGDTQRHRQEQYWETAKLYSNEFVVFNAARIPQGFNSKYPFTLKIPTVARETYYSVDNNVKWWMQTTVRVRGRPSIETENREIMVAKQQIPPPPPPQIVSKETIREVVLIPCSYCGGLMPQTSTFCPNCGARRRA
jgi:sporulation-control protein spo0M